MPILDNDEQEMLPEFFDECNAFIDKGRCTGAVLVHCTSGISRGGSVIIAYIMFSMNLSYDEAFILVRKARACVWPNDGFRKYLMAYSISPTFTGSILSPQKFSESISSLSSDDI